MTIGERVKKYRERHRLSLKALEARVGVSQAYLGMMEREEVKAVGPKIAKKLAPLLRVKWPRLCEASPDGQGRARAGMDGGEEV